MAATSFGDCASIASRAYPIKIHKAVDSQKMLPRLLPPLQCSSCKKVVSEEFSGSQRRTVDSRLSSVGLDAYIMLVNVP